MPNIREGNMNEIEKFWEQEEVILDSGERRKFESGAVRDMATKGRCDLLPWSTIGSLITIDRNSSRYQFCGFMEEAVHEKDHEDLMDILKNLIFEFCDIAYENDKFKAILDVAFHYEAGCKKYGDRNWEKGIPIIVYLDSAGRHFLKYMDGWKDERHDRAVVWNLLCAMWTLENRPKMIGESYENS